jgi:hypothetical protein
MSVSALLITLLASAWISDRFAERYCPQRRAGSNPVRMRALRR